MKLITSKGLAATLLAGTASLASPLASLAADLGGPSAEYVEHSAATLIWNGFYGGFNVGYGWKKENARIEGVDPLGKALVARGFIPSALGIATDGVVLGGQIGYNRQQRQFVYGVEFDADFSKLSGAETLTVGRVATTVDRSINWLATLRGRAGMLVTPSTLVYGTGGLAFGETTLHAAYQVFPACLSTFCGESTSSRIATGWTIGAGLEHALNSSATLKVEYLYVDLGSQSLTFKDAVFPDPTFKVQAENTANILRAGMNFKF